MANRVFELPTVPCALIGFDLIDADGKITSAAVDGHTVDAASWCCTKCHTMLGIHSHGYITEVSISTPQVLRDRVGIYLLMPRKGTNHDN